MQIPHKNSTSQINKLCATDDNNFDIDDKTVVNSNACKMFVICNRIINDEIQTPVNHCMFNARRTGHSLLLNAPSVNKQLTTYNEPTVHHPS